MSHVGHGRIVCSCGRVIAQCRCMGNVRILEVKPHPACGTAQPLREPSSAAELVDLSRIALRHVSAYPQLSVAVDELAGIVRLLDQLRPGDRLVVGLDGDGAAFACIDMAPPVDRGPLVEAATMREALARLAVQAGPF